MTKNLDRRGLSWIIRAALRVGILIREAEGDWMDDVKTGQR